MALKYVVGVVHDPVMILYCSFTALKTLEAASIRNPKILGILFAGQSF
jgi:hypothetical protein